MKDINNKDMKDMIDKGWKDMSILLDEKMPVSHVKRSNKLKYLLLLLLFAFGTGVYFILNDSFGKGEINNHKIDSNERKEAKDINSFAKIELKDSKATTVSITPTTSIEGTNLNNKENNNDKIEAQRNLLDSDSNIEKRNVKIKYKTTTENKNRFNKRSDSNNSDEFVKTKTEDPTVERKSTKSFNQEITNKIALLSLNEIKVNSIELPAPIMSSNIFFNRNRCLKYDLVFNLNAISENLKSLGGFNSGLTLNYNFNRSFSIETGLGFSYFQKRGMTNSFLTTFNIKPVFDPQRWDNPRQIGSRDNTAFNIGVRSPYVMSRFIRELYYIDLPISVRYRVNKYSVSLGMKASYLVSGTNYTANKDFYAGQNFVIYSNKAFYNSRVYNRLNYSLIFSFDYDITNRIKLSTGFNYSSTGLINRPENQLNKNNEFDYRIDEKYKDRYDKNIYFSLGMKCRILSKCL